VFDYVFLHPTYPLSLHRSLGGKAYYKIFGLGSKKEEDFLHKQSNNKISNSALGVST
jgi:hypothetical protein